MLEATARYKINAPTFPNGTHVCEVEIDPETGVVQVVGYHVVDDFGTIVNPLLLTGQVQGQLPKASARHCSKGPSTILSRGSSSPAPSSITDCRARTTSRRSTSASTASRASPTRSASKARVRRERSVPAPQ